MRACPPVLSCCSHDGTCKEGYLNLAHALLWLAALSLMVVGLAGTILPILPGVPIIYAGMLIAAWIDDFARIGWPTLLVLAVLTVLTLVADFLAGVLGAQRAGASRQALIGSVLGGLAGLAFGIPGLVLGPFIGAVVGELLARGGVAAAARVGLATWVGLLLGTLAKLALAVTMIAIFAASYLLA
jgi:uncharacterized protein YqgC (DUF456 family)